MKNYKAALECLNQCIKKFPYYKFAYHQKGLSILYLSIIIVRIRIVERGIRIFGYMYLIKS